MQCVYSCICSCSLDEKHLIFLTKLQSVIINHSVLTNILVFSTLFSLSDPGWTSINRGVLICDECCSVHRSLGRHISIVKHLRHSGWPPSLLQVRLRWRVKEAEIGKGWWSKYSTQNSALERSSAAEVLVSSEDANPHLLQFLFILYFFFFTVV